MRVIKSKSQPAEVKMKLISYGPDINGFLKTIERLQNLNYYKYSVVEVERESVTLTGNFNELSRELQSSYEENEYDLAKI